MASSEVTSAASFALSVLRTSPSSRSSFVFSPFSLGAALAMLHEGAAEDGKDELTQLLLKGHTSDEVAAFYSTLTKAMSSEDDGKNTAATTANRLYIDQSFMILDEYRSRIREQFGAGVETLSFIQAKSAADEINRFVEEKTKKKIKELVNADSIANSAAVLVNAVHFKESWKMEFQKSHTKHETFFGVDRERQEPFMHQRQVPARFGRLDDVTTLALDYKDTTYSMIILLPDESKFETVRASLTAKKLFEIINQLRKENIDVSLPKFTIDSSLDGAKALRALDVSAIFDKAGSLAGISRDGRLKVSDIIHKAVIEVNEVGTEAAAATAVVMRMRRAIAQPSLSFRADRPFLYAVLKDATHVLFLGQYC